jgi:hypothetical protein|eukprot:COSAG01_NODE_7292_length_3265_cov_15.785850_1_plen_203_part_00
MMIGIAGLVAAAAGAGAGGASPPSTTWPFGRLLNRSDFVSRYWQRQCLHLAWRADRDGPPPVLLSTSEVDWLVFTAVGLSSGDPDGLGSTDLTLSRRRRRRRQQVGGDDDDEPWSEELDWQRALPVTAPRGPGWWLAPTGHSKLLELAHRAFTSGFSLIVHGANRRWAALGDAAALLSRQLGHPVNTNLYLTPAGAPGFGAC